jgi:hypothetical protein
MKAASSKVTLLGFVCCPVVIVDCVRKGRVNFGPSFFCLVLFIARPTIRRC